MKDFRDLQVWRKAHWLALDSYQETTRPKHEMFGMTSHIRRAAVSIAANISEGCAKRGNGGFQRFLNVATGSASELEYHFLSPHDFNLFEEVTYRNSNVVEVKRMLAALARKVDAERLAG